MKMRLDIVFALLAVAVFGGTAAQAQTMVCKGDQVCLTISGHRGSVQWQSSPDNLTWTSIPSANGDTLCFPAETISYYRAAITEGACATVYSDTSYVEAVEIIADAGVDQGICGGGNATLGGATPGSGGSGPYTYAWSPGTGLSATNVGNPLASISGPFTYYLTVTDANGCSDVDTVSVDTAGNAAPGSVTFSYTGGVQTFVVPTCVTNLNVDMYGAQGGANWVNNVNYGGRVQATVPVTPGETLYVYVGEQPTVGTNAGWNGGGAGDGAGKGGGGASDIRQNGQTLNDRIVVAGAGGGAGYWSSLHVVGGPGGGLTGGDGYRDPSYASNPGGLGGTQSAGGANGTCINLYTTTMAGSFGQGGTPLGFSCGCEGYGGGGGWYGGAGSGNCRGAGGGSSYTVGTATNVTHTQGARMGHGEVILSW